LTAALAYSETSESLLPQLGGEEAAAEELAVVWAVVRFAESMPTSVEDRRALEKAHTGLRAIATALGTDEAGMKELLRRRYELLARNDQPGRDPCPADAPGVVT